MHINVWAMAIDKFERVHMATIRVVEGQVQVEGQPLPSHVHSTIRQLKRWKKPVNDEAFMELIAKNYETGTYFCTELIP